MTEALIHPVILSGGSGSRLWPLSRAGYPKQFLTLQGSKSMLQATALRVAQPGFADPLMICNDDHRFIVDEQLRTVNIEPARIILEPIGRNTAPAVAVAALALTEQQDDALMLVMPSDHIIMNESAFLNAVSQAKAAAMHGKLVTFGIEPTAPETGYGYIQKGQELTCMQGVNAVMRFVEKPDAATAQSYLDSGQYAWNSGIFLFSAKRFLAELAKHNQAIINACQQALTQAENDLSFCRLNKVAFAQCPADSIDYAVMEKTKDAAVVPVSMGWSDLGSWGALWDIEQKDTQGNASKGEVLLHNTRNSYVYTDHPLVAVTGLDNIIVIATDDAIFVCDKNNTQDVKKIVDQLKTEGRTEHLLHTTVHRPWGNYRGIDQGERYQVKRITVKPGERLSLQMHHHRAEHWIVVSGTALITNGDKTALLHENESTFIPIGETHRLENPGKVPLHLIEVQSGSYLGEDDIVRFEDGYGRADQHQPEHHAQTAAPRQSAILSAAEHTNSQPHDELRQQNEILLQHVRQLQDELEYYFSEHQKLKKENGELQKYQKEATELQNKLDRIRQQANPHFHSAKVAEVAKNVLRWEFTDVDLAGQEWPRVSVEGQAGFAKTQITIRAGNSEPWTFSTDSQNQILTISQWALTQAVPEILGVALNSATLSAKQQQTWHKALEKLQAHINKQPPRLLYKQVHLRHEQVNEDYEHLWLTLEHPSFKELSFNERPESWSFRISCAGVTPNEFGQQPKLEVPEQENPLLESWFHNAQDTFGRKFELRFALPDAMDQGVWNSLSADDQAMLRDLVEQLPVMLHELAAQGVQVTRPWEDWQTLAANMQRILHQKTRTK